MKEKVIAQGLKFLALVWAFLTPIKGLVLFVGILVLLDMIFGIWAARKRGEAITSNRMRSSVSKSTAYLLVILAGFMMDSIIDADTVIIARALAVLIGTTELKSLTESAADITGIHFWSTLIDKLKPPPSPKHKDDK